MAHDLIQSTTVALRIELAIDPVSPQVQREISRTGIQSGLLFLRQASCYWERVQSSLRLLEWVVRHKNLGPVESIPDALSGPEPTARLPGATTSTSPEGSIFPDWQTLDFGGLFHIPLDSDLAEHLPDLDCDFAHLHRRENATHWSDVVHRASSLMSIPLRHPLLYQPMIILGLVGLKVLFP